MPHLLLIVTPLSKEWVTYRRLILLMLLASLSIEHHRRAACTFEFFKNQHCSLNHPAIYRKVGDPVSFSCMSIDFLLIGIFGAQNSTYPKEILRWVMLVNDLCRTCAQGLGRQVSGAPEACGHSSGSATESQQGPGAHLGLPVYPR